MTPTDINTERELRMNMAQTELSQLRKEYGEVTAVDDFSLTLADGEFLVLLGPSGCGKSTTLRMVAGLEDATDGTILVDGDRVNEQGPAARDFAMVFQQVALYPHMTVRENISSPLRADGVERETINDQVEHTAGLLDIEELLDRQPGELSGGQQQRVAIGRALVREPQAFLLDEPFSKLDQKLRTQLQKELKRLQDEMGVTTVFVTHDQEEAMVLADRIAIMDDGELQQVGPPETIYEQPTNRFVADFIGNPTMNFFDVEIVDEDLHIGGVPYRDVTTTDAITDARSMAARPEDIVVQQSPGSDRLAVDVELIEMHGSMTYLICTLGETEVTILKQDEDTISEGDTLALEFDFDGVNFFDEEGTLLQHAGQNVRSVQ